MRISLLYNEDAGDGLSARELGRMIERAGHKVIHELEDEADLQEVLEDAPDLVVAGGGDGTVWRAVSALLGHDVPLAILPLGTANNVARSLGVTGSVEEAIAGWSHATRRRFDHGMAVGSWGERRFIEGIGSGLVTSGIRAMDREPPPDHDEDAEEKLARAVRRYRDVLSELRPRRWTIKMDDVRMEGEFLLVEVLNIRSVGPNLVLAPDADPFDGCFDVVIAGEEQREEMDCYLEARIAGQETRLSLPLWRARGVDITGWEDMHVDDEVVSGPPIGTVSITMEASALNYLAPEPSSIEPR
jgi:diacylglycerol kinase (ATP)